MQGVRFRPEGFEGKCDECLEHFPLTLEFWRPREGLRKCRACLNDATNEKLRRRRSDPAYRESERLANAAQRRVSREAFLEYQRRWYRQNRERLTAERRERYARLKAAA